MIISNKLLPKKKKNEKEKKTDLTLAKQNKIIFNYNSICKVNWLRFDWYEYIHRTTPEQPEIFFCLIITK